MRRIGSFYKLPQYRFLGSKPYSWIPLSGFACATAILLLSACTSKQTTVEGAPAIRLVDIFTTGETTEPTALIHTNLTALTLDGWKLVRQEDTGNVTLHNLSAEPQDNTDLTTENPDQVQFLKAELDGWEERALSVRLVSGLPPADDVSADELEMLETLGYL